MISNFALQTFFGRRPRGVEKFRSQEKHSRPRVSIHRFIISLRDDQTIAERRRAVLVRIKLERLAHQLPKIRDAVFAAWLNEKLQFISSHAQRLRDVCSGNEIANQHWLFVDEAKAGDTGLIDLRDDRFVADAANLHTCRYDDRDVRGSAVGRIIMKRKPARGVHQIRSFRTNIGQALIGKRSALGRSQRAAPTNAHRDRLCRRHDLSEIDSHVWSKRACSNRVLHKSSEGFAVLLDTIDVQRAVQFKDDRSGRVLRH